MPRDRAFQLLESAARTALCRQASAVRNPHSRATSSENLPTGTATAPLPSGIRADEPSRPKASRQTRPLDPKRQESARPGNPIRKPPCKPGDRGPSPSGIRAAAPPFAAFLPGAKTSRAFLPPARPRSAPTRQETAGKTRCRQKSAQTGTPIRKPPGKPGRRPPPVRNPRRRAVSPQSLPANPAAGSQTSGIRAAGQSHPKTSLQTRRPGPSRQESAPQSPSREKPPSKASSRSQPATRPTGIPRPTHRLLAAECRTLSAIPPNNQVQIHAQIESSSRDSRAPRCAIHAAAL